MRGSLLGPFKGSVVDFFCFAVTPPVCFLSLASAAAARSFFSSKYVHHEYTRRITKENGGEGKKNNSSSKYIVLMYLTIQYVLSKHFVVKHEPARILSRSSSVRLGSYWIGCMVFGISSVLICVSTAAVCRSCAVPSLRPY
jgi:hypothetical protein